MDPMKFLSALLFVIFGLFANTPEAIIFDCDGVLVDTEYLKFQAWKESLELYGVDLSLDEYKTVAGYSSKAILAKIKEIKQIDILDEVIAVKNERYKKLQKQGVKPIHEMIDIVRWLHKNKNFKLALASSAPQKEIQENLRQIGLQDLFDLVISGSDDLVMINDPEGKNKPKPYIYLEAAKRLRVAPEVCIVIEDSSAGVEAASKAGMYAIAFPNEFTIDHDFTFASKVLSSYELLGTFFADRLSLNYHPETFYFLNHSMGDVDKRVSPCSTFKIALSLMGYDLGILKDENTPSWNYEEGYDDYLPQWKQSQTPQTWMKYSCVWYSKLLFKEIGTSRFQEYLSLFNYGNQDGSGLPASWLSSTLKISAKEQVLFLENFINSKLPVSQYAIDKTKQLLYSEECDGFKLYGKTGANQSIGWFIGYIEKNDQTFPFAYYIEGSNLDLSARIPRAKELISRRLKNH